MPDERFIATISVNGRIYSAWESIILKRVFGYGYAAFEFTPTENGYGKDRSALQFGPGDPVTVTLAGKKAFTGWIKTRIGAGDARSKQLVVAGESKPVDLVRSSAIVKPGGFNGSTLEQAARAVMAPHGIALIVKNAPAIFSKTFKHLNIQYGESVAEFLHRIGAMRSVFYSDDVDGNLIVGQADPKATPAADLVLGENILRYSFKLEDPAACSWSKLAAVTQQPGDDDGRPARDIAATATNSGVRANVTRTGISIHTGDAVDVTGVVNHAMMRSEWPIMEVSIAVAGWLRPDGELWAPAPDSSGSVTVFNPEIFPGQTSSIEMDIQGVVFQQDIHNGTTTTLELKKKGALTSVPTSGLSDTGGSSSVPSSTPTPATPNAPDWQGGGSGTPVLPLA